jgi:hypothetical protein
MPEVVTKTTCTDCGRVNCDVTQFPFLYTVCAECYRKYRGTFEELKQIGVSA